MMSTGAASGSGKSPLLALARSRAYRAGPVHTQNEDASKALDNENAFCDESPDFEAPVLRRRVVVVQGVLLVAVAVSAVATWRGEIEFVLGGGEAGKGQAA